MGVAQNFQLFLFICLWVKNDSDHTCSAAALAGTHGPCAPVDFKAETTFASGTSLMRVRCTALGRSLPRAIRSNQIMLKITFDSGKALFFYPIPISNQNISMVCSRLSFVFFTTTLFLTPSVNDEHFDVQKRVL